MCILLDIFPMEVPTARFPVTELEVRRILYGHSQPNPAEYPEGICSIRIPTPSMLLTVPIARITLAVTGGGTLGWSR